ncbi:hypothetical protein EBT16_04785 [bacterium]|nr:hypothetical protein [bacterium]
MGVCYTANISSKKAHLLSTEKAFLGRQCEEIAASYLTGEKKWRVIARNVRFRTGEVDLVAEDPQTQMRWVVEVRGRQASPQKASKWLPVEGCQKPESPSLRSQRCRRDFWKIPEPLKFFQTRWKH